MPVCAANMDRQKNGGLERTYLSSGQRFCLFVHIAFRNFVRISDLAYFLFKFVWVGMTFPKIAVDSGTGF
jgi:hypothetical protein